MPYTLKTLAIEFRRIKETFKIFKKLKMIKVTEDKVFYKYREKKREEKRIAEELKKAESNEKSTTENCNAICNTDDTVTLNENIEAVTQENKKEIETIGLLIVQGMYKKYR